MADLDPLREAEFALRMDELEEAEHLYRVELSADDASRRAAALEGLGQLAARRDDPRAAIDFFEQAVSLYGDDAVGRVALNETLGRSHALAGEFEAAIGVFERALRHAEERESLPDVVRFRLLLSYAVSDVGQLGRAEELLGGALAHADELTDPQARVRLNWAQCRLQVLKQRPDRAAHYGAKVIELLELTEDSFQLARAHRLMARVELDRGRLDEALESVERARAFLGGTEHRVEEANLCLMEAGILARLGQLARARTLAMDVSGAFADMPEEAGHSYVVLARTFAEAGDNARAIELMELACELLERAPNRFLVGAYSELADLLEAEGKKGRSFEIRRKALEAQALASKGEIGRS